MVKGVKGEGKNMTHKHWGDTVFYAVTNIVILLVLAVVLYPVIFILSASFSSPEAVSSGKVLLWPVELSLEGYKAVFQTNAVMTGYRNSIFYTVAGTLINVAVTMIAAYPLSRKDLPGRNAIMFFFTFTMIFSGGMIPAYILVKNLGMLNSVWALLIPGALSVYNMIIARTFIQNNVPGELLMAAKIDGCSDARYFFSILLPLSKAVIAVITLYYAIGHWNSYFSAFLYITNEKLYPLQLVLRDILVANTIDPNMIIDPELAQIKQGLSDLLKYSLMVVSVLPVMLIYPMVQKHFVKGVMIGSIKG